MYQHNQVKNLFGAQIKSLHQLIQHQTLQIWQDCILSLFLLFWDIFILSYLEALEPSSSSCSSRQVSSRNSLASSVHLLIMPKKESWLDCRSSDSWRSQSSTTWSVPSILYRRPTRPFMQVQHNLIVWRWLYQEEVNSTSCPASSARQTIYGFSFTLMYLLTICFHFTAVITPPHGTDLLSKYSLHSCFFIWLHFGTSAPETNLHLWQPPWRSNVPLHYSPHLVQGFHSVDPFSCQRTLQ